MVSTSAMMASSASASCLGVIFGFMTGVVILILGIVLVAQRPTAGGASAGATSTKGGAPAVSPIVSPTGGGASPDYVRLL